jgi:hypothetical protein
MTNTCSNVEHENLPHQNIVSWKSAVVVDVDVEWNLLISMFRTALRTGAWPLEIPIAIVYNLALPSAR